MSDEIVTTNLRIQKAEWLKLKTMAAELNLSANEYILFLIRTLSGKRQLGALGTPSPETAPIWGIRDLAKGRRSSRGLSTQDEEIYGDSGTLK